VNTFRVVEYGAVPDGKTVNTDVIQNAINDCSKRGGGRVIFDCGDFRTGTIILKNNVELHIEAGSKLTGDEKLNSYKDLVASGIVPGAEIENSKNALIIGTFAENISITGKGEINGSGPAFYDDSKADHNGKFAKPQTPRPRIMMFYRCKNVFIRDISLINSACWTIWLMQCENVFIDRVRIYGDRRLRNIDGIDIDSCKNVFVSNCLIDTEDDCIAVRSIKNVYQQPSACENINVSNSIFKTSCNGIRVGCPDDGEIKNCTFNNIIISESANGILFEFPHRYFSGKFQASASIHDIMFSNFIINSHRSAISLFIEEGIAIQRLSDISFSNIRVIRAGSPVKISGSSQSIIKNIRLENLEFNGYQQPFFCQWCDGIYLNGVRFLLSQTGSG